MIVCMRCGATNEDSQWSCHACGHKLQSLRRGGPVGRGLAETLRPLRDVEQGGRFRSLLLRCVEVWAVAGLTIGLALWGVARTSWWPVLGAVLAGGAYALLRR